MRITNGSDKALLREGTFRIRDFETSCSKLPFIVGSLCPPYAARVAHGDTTNL